MRLMVLLLSLSAAALAQEEPDLPDGPVQPRQEVDFNALDVNATVQKPQIGVAVEAKPPPGRHFLRLREDFGAEMSRSLREVR